MQRKYSRQDPGCYHRMLEYLSIKTGIDLFKDVVVKSVWKTSPHTGKKKLIHPASNITVVDNEGGTHPYMLDQRRYDLRGIEANHFVVSLVRSSDEFGITINHAGNYRDSLGGGWYSNCHLLEVDGRYFATMECACGHNGFFVKPAVKDSVTNSMNNFDPNEKQAAEGQEVSNEQLQATEQEAQEKAMESEETEG